MKQMSWIERFLSEKGVSKDETFDVEGPEWGINTIPVHCIVDLYNQAPKHEQAKITATLIQLDLRNGDVRHYLKHLAKAVAL